MIVLARYAASSSGLKALSNVGFDLPEAMSPAKLRVAQLSKVFDYRTKRLTVLESIDLNLYPNEFVCLVGPSGCGKSTLLNIIAGLVLPSGGEVWVDEHTVSGPGADRGMVFQSYSLFPWLTVAKNIDFGLKLQRLSKAERRERIAYYLDVVGLSHFADAYPKQLSGGMKQRAAIARALANEPEVLLMDEPFGALDAQTKEQMQQFMQAIWERTQMSILMVTHDIEEAIFLSHRVYVMDTHPGRIKQEISIPLPEHRELALKSEISFMQIKRQITQLISH